MNVLELLNQGSKNLKQRKIISHRLEEFLEGEAFDEMIESLTLQAQEDSLSSLN